MSLDDLIASAREQGVKMVVCQMSMDIMGLKAEELIDGLEFAGVASYLSDADDANVNLFI
jgi:peroxiredoxin family protein